MKGGSSKSLCMGSRNVTYLEDQWCYASLAEAGYPAAHGTLVHVYLNGLYWGIYSLFEVHLLVTFGHFLTQCAAARGRLVRGILWWRPRRVLHWVRCTVLHRIMTI